MCRITENINICHKLANKFKYLDQYEYEDIFQIACEGMVIADKKYKEGDKCKFTTYAYMVANSHIIDAIKTDKWNMVKQSERLGKSKNIPVSIYDKNGNNTIINNPSNLNLEQEVVLKLQLEKFLSVLTREELENIVAYYIEEMTFKEIAKIRKCSDTKINLSIKRTIDKIRINIVV